MPLLQIALHNHSFRLFTYRLSLTNVDILSSLIIFTWHNMSIKYWFGRVFTYFVRLLHASISYKAVSVAEWLTPWLETLHQKLRLRNTEQLVEWS